MRAIAYNGKISRIGVGFSSRLFGLAGGWLARQLRLIGAALITRVVGELNSRLESNLEYC